MSTSAAERGAGAAAPAGKPAASRPGRRRGNPDTRQSILDAAATSFADNGFLGTTIRRIAARAGVDPALVHHYFGSKQQLFLASVHIPADITAIARQLVAGDRDDLGRRIVRTILTAWDGPAQPALLALLRSVMAEERSRALVREFVVSQIITKVLRGAGIPREELDLRGSLVFSQVLGLLASRYVIGIGPLPDLTPDRVADLVGPTLQRYITGELP